MSSVQPEWCLSLPLQQQSVLLLGSRGPDGIAKAHPSKEVHRAYRATVLMAARYNRMLQWGEKGDDFMCLWKFSHGALWLGVVREFFLHSDDLPHHYLMHLYHGAQIIGYKHPDERYRVRWLDFYHTGCRDLHLTAESEAQMDQRLSDWGQREWVVYPSDMGSGRVRFASPNRQ